MDCHILVADDDPPLREAITNLFQDEGYLVLQAEDGYEALDALRASVKPVVVILDYQMPRLGGDGVLRQVLQEDDLATRHAYVLCTANDRTMPLSIMNLLQQVGATVVHKPFDIDTLVEQVHRACDDLLAGSRA